MASLKKTLTLKNLLIDSRDMLTVQELDKDECRTYSLIELLKPFCDTEGVTLTVAIAEYVPESEE